MSNGHACCLLGVCCPPGSAEQAEAFGIELALDHPGLDPETVRTIAAWTLKHFDLAPAGSLTDFKIKLSEHLRKADR